MLREMHGEHGPRFTVCYGKSNWAYYREIFPGCEFSPAPGIDSGEALLGVQGRCRILLTKHFAADGVSKAGFGRWADALGGQTISTDSFARSWSETLAPPAKGSTNSCGLW